MRRPISILFVCIIISVLFTGNALAYTAYSYGTQYPDLDTRPAAQNVNSRLNSIGYSSSYQPSVSAATAYSQMQNANVWFFNGHGGNGYIAFYNPGYRFITGTLHNPPYDNAISQLTNGVLNDCALAVFVACGSGNSDATMGNLLDQSQMNGVDTALGFSGVLDATKSDYWAQQFAYYLDQQYSIYNAAAQAATDTYRNKFGYGGTNTYVIRGSLGATIDPARAGW